MEATQEECLLPPAPRIVTRIRLQQTFPRPLGLFADTGVDGMTMRYVGRIPLAKSYGTLGLYCVRAAD